MHSVELIKWVDQAKNIITFWFRPEKPIKYIAGQYIEMHLPHPNPDKRGIKRWFTLSSSPTDTPLISITTKFAEKSSSFKTALKNLKVGDSLQISEPMGDFVLPKDKSTPLLFVAGGIGVTPFHSIIKYLNDTKETRRIELIYAVGSAAEMAFSDLWQAYPLAEFKKIVTSSSEQLDAETIFKQIGGQQDKLTYISGPEPMVEKFTDELIAMGVKSEMLVGDFFPNYTNI